MLSRSLETVMQLASYVTDPISSQINENLETRTPTEIMMLTLASYLIITKTYQVYSQWDTKEITKRLSENALLTLKRFPVIGPRIEAEINEEVFGISDGIKADIDKKRMLWDPITKLSKAGLTKEQILERFKTLQDNYHEGKISGAVYAKYDQELQKLLEEVWGKTALTNPMHSEWTLINLMEAEVLSICHELLHSPLNGLLKKLEDVKTELANITKKAMETQPVLAFQYSQLVTKRESIKEKLRDKQTSEGAFLLQELKTVKKAIKNICEQAIKANTVLYKTYIPLSKERAELEKKTRNPGIITHGGSTSIFEACKAYVFRAREKGITKPVILIPETAHVSFDKAAKILDAKLVKIPVNKETGRVDLVAMEKAIKCHKKNIAMMVGSAPSFPYGIIDPIPELGALAKKYDIPLHVDSCLGGFLTAFAKEAGINLPSCDFSIPGVSSISIDTHKYGETPKGTSVLVFSPDCNASTVHVHLDFPGGMYVSEGIDGSRSGADIATAWTVINKHGNDYYVQETKEIVSLRKDTENAIRQIGGLQLAYDKAEPFKLNVIGIRAKADIDLLLIEKYFSKQGWSIQIMQTLNQKVDGLHFCLTSIHANNPHFVKEFHQTLQEAFNYAQSKPHEEAEGNIKIYGKLKDGVPFFVQKEIGESYIGALNTIRPMPGKK